MTHICNFVHFSVRPREMRNCRGDFPNLFVSREVHTQRQKCVKKHPFLPPLRFGGQKTRKNTFSDADLSPKKGYFLTLGPAVQFLVPPDLAVFWGYFWGHRCTELSVNSKFWVEKGSKKGQKKKIIYMRRDISLGRVFFRSLTPHLKHKILE